MNRVKNNIHAASGVAQDKKVRVRALGRGARSKSKLHSPPQADHHRKPTNAVATRLGRQMGAAHRKSTRVSPKYRDLAIGNWNVSSLTGKEQELVWEAKQYHLDIVGVSSTKRRGSGTVELAEGWKLFYSGVDPTMSAQAGVGLLISPRLAHCVVDWTPLGGRVCLLKLKLQKRSVCILQVYAPNMEKQYQPFLDEVSDALQKLTASESVILLGDFNAHVGTDNMTWKGVIGKHGDPHTNKNGKDLLQFCATNGLCIMNTFFQHKRIHKYTWYRESLGQRSLIDFCIVSADLFSSVSDVRVKRGAELSTDHHLVVCSVKELRPAKPHKELRPQKTYRIKWESLADEKIRSTFASAVASMFKDLPCPTDDIETEWNLFRTAVITSAATSCGRKRVGVAKGGEKRTPWWNQEVKEAILAKKAAYKAWISNKSSANLRMQYTSARTTAATKVKESKERAWEEFGQKLDNDYRTANKVFWQTIRRLRGKRSKAATFIEDADGDLLTHQTGILNRWREYFCDLLNPVSTTPTETSNEEQIGEEIHLTETEVKAAIKSLKAGKAPGKDGIRPEMLKAMNGFGVRWLTRVCKVAWKTGKVPQQWQTSVIIPIHKKGDKKKCTNYRGISLLSLPGKVYAKCLEKRCREIVESKLEDAQCGFRPGRCTMDQIFALQQIFEKSWEYAKDVYACFVDLEKAYDRVPRDKLWAVLLEYGVNGQLLSAIKSLYKQSTVYVRVNGKETKPFNVSVGLRQGCVLSPLLFIIYMDKIDKNSGPHGGVQIGECSIRRLLFADDLVMLDSTESGLQQALDRFSTSCRNAGMKISTSKTEVMCLSRRPVQCSLQTNGVTLQQTEKFKYLGVSFSSDGRQNNELDIRIGKASAVMRQLHRSVVLKRELSLRAKLSIFRSVFVPILTYGHECWIMTERVRSRIQAAEMGFLRRISGFTLLDKVKSTDIREFLDVEPLLLRLERSQLRWYGHVSRMTDDRTAHQLLLALPSGRRPRGCPRIRWRNYAEDLAWSRLGIPPTEFFCQRTMQFLFFSQNMASE